MHRRVLAWVTAAVFILGGCLAAPVSRAEPPDVQTAVVAHIQDATVALIYRPEGGDWRIYCSGVRLEGGDVLTAEHCTGTRVRDVDGYLWVASWRDYRRAGGRPERIAHPKAYRVFDVDERQDLALLQAVRNPSWGAYAQTSKVPPTGSHVWLMGHPAGILAWTLTEGIVSRATRRLCFRGECRTRIQASAPGWYGNSGGGLWDDAGRLIGIASSGASDRTGMNIVPHLMFFAPAVLCETLNGHTKD